MTVARHTQKVHSHCDVWILQRPERKANAGQPVTLAHLTAGQPAACFLSLLFFAYLPPVRHSPSQTPSIAFRLKEGCRKPVLGVCHPPPSLPPPSKWVCVEQTDRRRDRRASVCVPFVDTSCLLERCVCVLGGGILKIFCLGSLLFSVWNAAIIIVGRAMSCDRLLCGSIR